MTDIETINRLAEILGSSGGAAVAEYTKYFVFNSIIWVSVGLFIVIAAWRWKMPEWDFPPVLVKGFVIFIGLLFIGCNLPDIFAPKAMAIHQIIRDVRG